MVKKVEEFFQTGEVSLAEHVARCQALLEQHPKAHFGFMVCDDAWHLYESEQDAIEDRLEYRREEIKQRLEWAQRGVDELTAQLNATYNEKGGVVERTEIP